MNATTIRRISERVKAGIPYTAKGGADLRRELLSAPGSLATCIYRHTWDGPDGQDDFKCLRSFARSIEGHIPSDREEEVYDMLLALLGWVEAGFCRPARVVA